MKTYTVSDIAEKLKTNPETVRRWIRQGKLIAEQSSRKGGNRISEQNLNKFLKDTPKYASIAAGAITVLGISSLVTSLLSNLMITKTTTDDYIDKVQEIIASVKSSIQASEKAIAAKKDEVEKLQSEIKTDEERIFELKKLLNQIQSQLDETTSNKKD